MTVTRHEIRGGAYYDSVILMQLQKGLAGLPGVVDAGVVMATPANKEILAESDLLPATVAAAADDLLLVIKAVDEATAVAALGRVDELLKARRTQTSSAFRSRSLALAARQLPEAGWVLVSVPGRYAAGVAREALDLGRHVFLYSDNVALQDEVALKEQAVAQGLLVMGPDCGTAVIHGIGLGFANRVRRGAIGVVAASGTGLQAILSHVDRLGAGISQAIGTGGRDLSPDVGARTALQAVATLAADPETDVIVLVSKPPDPTVAARLLGAARASGKPVVVAFLGYAPPARTLGGLHFAVNLREAAELAVQLVGTPPDRAPAGTANGFVRGLFSGGTLAYEALLALEPLLSPLYSNVPLRPSQALDNRLQSRGHTILDLGADDFTQGRLHPMMDNDLRLRRLRQEAADPAVGALMLDIVLGEGAHPDPASELAPAIAAVRAERPLPVAVILVGSEADPQDRAAQAEALAAAGAVVFEDTIAAVAAVAGWLGPPADVGAKPIDLGTELAAINVGVDTFYESVVGQGATAVAVDWRPPAGGNEKMMALLARLKASQGAGEGDD